jgi:hypothetical protein
MKIKRILIFLSELFTTGNLLRRTCRQLTQMLPEPRSRIWIRIGLAAVA